MSDFLEQPTSANAVMKGPVKRFGLMPKSVLDKNQLRSISAFIYDHELKIPKWFPEHFEENHGTLGRS